MMNWKIEKIIELTDEHIEAMEEIFETDEFTSAEVNDYVESLNLEESTKYTIEVIPATRKEFQKGILATVRYYNL